MKPVFPWLQKRLEENAAKTIKRPIRFALIFFGIILVLMEIGTVNTFYTEGRDHLDSLDGAILLVAGIALWLTLMATGWMLTPLKIRKYVHYCLFLVSLVSPIIGSLFFGLLIMGGIKVLHWIFVMNNVLMVTDVGVLIAWTFVSAWGWIRFIRGQSVD